MGNGTHVTQVVVTQISCTLSILGSSFIILTYFLWKDIRTWSRLLLVYLSMADFGTAAGYSFGNIMDFVYARRSSVIDEPLWCIVESIIANSMQMMSFFWTVSIAVFLYFTLVKENLTIVPKLMTIFHVVSWGVPSLIILIAACLRKLGSDDNKTSVGWCWIKVQDNNFQDTVLWMLIVGKGWEIVSYVLLPVIYFRIKCHISQQTTEDNNMKFQEETRAAMNKVNRKLLVIPMVYLLLRMWGTIRFLVFVAYKGKPSDLGLAETFLEVMHGFGDCFQGAANCIIFCMMTDIVRNRIAGGFERMFSRLRSGSRERRTRKAKTLSINHKHGSGSEPTSPTEKSSLLTCQSHPNAARSMRITSSTCSARVVSM